MSAKPAAIPLFGDAYLADTRHLTTEEHGAYLLLMMAAWRQDDCALPDDDHKLARITGLTLRKWTSIKPTMMEFWQVENGRLFQGRLRKERAYVDQKSESNRKSAEARWNKQTTENKQSGECDRISECNAPPPSPPQASKGEEAKASPPSARVNVEPFPCPVWCDDKQLWADFLDVRKLRKAKNTATAHAGFLTDIAKLANDEWPPGRLLRYAVAHSWAGIYEPKEGYPNSERPQPQRGFSGQGSTRDIGMDVARELAQRRAGGSVVDLLPSPGSSRRALG